MAAIEAQRADLVEPRLPLAVPGKSKRFVHVTLERVERTLDRRGAVNARRARAAQIVADAVVVMATRRAIAEIDPTLLALRVDLNICSLCDHQDGLRTWPASLGD